MEMLRADDPGTYVTRSSLDYFIREGTIPSVKVGNRILINYDMLLKILYEGGVEPEQPQENNTGVIRPIKV